MGKDSTSVTESLSRYCRFISLIWSLSTKLTLISAGSGNPSSWSTAWQQRRISIRTPVGTLICFCRFEMITLIFSILLYPFPGRRR